MGNNTGISWTDATWNIARGCTKVDEDCKYCYMYRESMDSTRYNPIEIKRTKTVFDLPLKLKEPSKIFTCSLTDFFHRDIDSYRHEAWSIIRRCPQHTFQILTKRPERIEQCLPDDWGNGWDNVWLGTSCGSDKSLDRVYDLLIVPSRTHFLSLEPLYGEIDIEKFYTSKFGHEEAYAIMRSIKWVIVGGESGNDTGKYRYRPCELSWIENIVNACKQNDIPVFVKQMGTYLAKQLGMKDRHGGDISEFPEHLKVRQFPTLISATDCNNRLNNA